jgi:hypothetical protein
MGLFDDAARARQPTPDGGDTDTTGEEPAGATVRSQGSTTTTQIRGTTVQIEGEDVAVARPDTQQPNQSGTWLTGGSDAYGIPRGVDAVENRQIVQTAAMQSIANGISDQLLGGDLAFIDDDEQLEGMGEAELNAMQRFRGILRDVLTGPHLGDEDLDDLVTAAVEDMLGPGNAYWQLLAPESGELPVVSLTSLDPLTIRHNVDEHGYPLEPPYWQASGAFSGGTASSIGNIDPVPLQASDVAVLRYPKGNRSYRIYPVSAAWQVKEWLEILANSTTHHNRFYADDMIPPGLLHVVGGSSSTVDTIKDKLEEASGDPRNAPVVGGDGAANWVEMGGTAINLDIIQEQQWFYELCLGSLGLGKAEVGMIEDVNRANGEIEAERVIKRVAGPFGKQFEQAFLHIARQFDAFGELGEPFTPTLARTDQRAERAKEQRLREMYNAGGLTLREYVRRRGDEDLAEQADRFTVDVNGQTIDYGEHPKWVAQRLFSVAGATDPEAADPAQGESESDSQQARTARQEGEPPFTDYPDAAVENARMARDALEDTGNPNDCLTDTGRETMRVFAEREGVSRERLGKISAFSRFEEDKEMDDEEGRADCGWIAWKSWGGDEGIAWASRKLEQLEDSE